MTPDDTYTPKLQPELRLFLAAIGFDRDDEIDWDELDQAALQPIMRWKLVAQALDLDRESAPSTGYLRQLASLPDVVENILAPFFDMTTGAHPTGIDLAEVLVKGVAERLTQHTAAIGRLAAVVSEGSKVLREALLPTYPELAQQEEDDKAAGKSRLLRLATLAAQALGEHQDRVSDATPGARWFRICEAFGLDPEEDPPVSIPAILAGDRWTNSRRMLADACAKLQAPSLEVVLGELVQTLSKARKVVVMGQDPVQLRNVDPDKMMAALSTPLEKRQTEPTKADNDQKQARDNAVADAAHYREKLAAAERDIADISRAYFEAGLGPSPASASAVATALAGIAVLKRDLEDAKAQILPRAATATRDRVEALEHAMNCLGWDGESDPLEWAHAQREATAIPTVGRMRQLEADLAALTSETTRLTALRDAQHHAHHAMLERLGWRTGMDPDAVISQATSAMQQMEDIKREFAAHPRLRVEGASVAGQVHDLLELLDRAGPGEGEALRAVADKLAADLEAAQAKLADADARHRERMDADARRGRERAQQKLQARRWVELCRTLGWPQHADPPASLAGFVDDRGHRGAFTRTAVAGYLSSHFQPVMSIGEVLERLVAELTIRRDEQIQKQPSYLLEQAQNILQKIREQAGNQEDTWSATLQRVRGLASLVGSLAALQAAADNPTAANIEIDMSQVDISDASEDAERRRLSAFILRFSAGAVSPDQIAAYDLAELRQVAQALAEGPQP